MAKKRKMKMEFRYYQMQDGIPILALLGESRYQGIRGWQLPSFHVSGGFCYGGPKRERCWEAYLALCGRGRIVPPNFPHGTGDAEISANGNICLSMWKGHKFGRRLRAEKMIQRIYSKALCLKESEYKSLSNKIIKIPEIMRASDEFYLEEANGILLALLAEVARMNRSSAEENIRKRKDVI